MENVLICTGHPIIIEEDIEKKMKKCIKIISLEQSALQKYQSAEIVCYFLHVDAYKIQKFMTNHYIVKR